MKPGPSILNMAEAMLDDEYRSSHSDLQQWGESILGQVENNEEPDKGESLEYTKKNYRSSDDDERRVVIQVPPKRRKISYACNSPKDVVDSINNSMSREDRLAALNKALLSFDHDQHSIHDSEIEGNADIALVKMLAFLEFKTGFRRHPIKADLGAITQEISMTCQALEMIYRASSEYVGRSFIRVGTDLLHILVILIDEEVKSRMTAFASPYTSPECSSAKTDGSDMQENDEQQQLPLSDDEEKQMMNPQQGGGRSVTPPMCRELCGVDSSSSDLVLRKATKILGHYARVGQATKALAHFPGLLGSMLNLINLRPYDAVPWEARLSCLWTIANLACNADNMTMMMCTPGLINALINVSFRPVQVSEPLEKTMEVLRARSIASRALLNLSWPPENKIPMAENMALVQLLCQLAIERDPPFRRSRTMQNIMVQTRRHAVGCIRNLAAAPRRSKIGLCDYNNGKILDVLTEAAVNDNDQRVIDLAFAAIHNLAIHDTAEMMVDRAALVLALKNMMLADDEEEVDKQLEDNNEASRNSPKSHASSTLLVLERSITPEMPSYEYLRELLDSINPTCTTNDAEEDEATSTSDTEDEVQTAAV